MLLWFPDVVAGGVINRDRQTKEQEQSGLDELDVWHVEFEVLSLVWRFGPHENMGLGMQIWKTKGSS